MSPLDDQLRQTLAARAATVTPAADPLAGLDARVSRLRRRRAAAAVSSTALLVAAVALLVPLVQQAGHRAPSQPATSITSTPTPTPGRSADSHRPPPNLVTWLPRGDANAGPSTADLLAAFAAARHATVADVAYQPAYTASTAGGLRFTVGQAWVTGDAQALTVGYATGGTHGAQLLVERPAAVAPPDLAVQFSAVPGSTSDLLVVVPRIGAGPVDYSPSTGAAFTQVANGRSSLEGVGLVERAVGAVGDRLRVYEGDAMHLLYDGPVQPLLCPYGAPCPTA